MRTIKIGNKIIGHNQPCFVIAEAGINHNGNLQLAKKLIDMAVKAGADAVKFQTFKAENLATKAANMTDYQIKNIGKEKSQLDMLKNLEIAYGNFRVLKDYCDKKDIIFLSTPHSFDAIDFLENLVPAYKFGSGDIANIPALKHAAERGKPIILGTGMSTLDEVKDAVNAIKSKGNEQIVVLHCTTNYPCPFREVNLRSMITMQKELDCIVGYSDHTLGILVPIVATALGATVIEKHFTIDKSLPGPDHKASLEPDELKKMIVEIKKTEKVLGRLDKRPTESEKEIMKFVRKSIIAKKGIEKGSVINEDKIIIKRPGTGLKPSDLDKIIGKKANRRILKDEVFQLDMVE